jgi:RNase P subunit RPR2
MKCIKCGTKMIPYGSPEKRLRHKDYTIYGCPKCHNVSSIIKLPKGSIVKPTKARSR